MYRAHKVLRQDGGDGTILLRSGYAMGPVTDKTGDWLDHWAAETPDAVFLAEREGAAWRSVRFAEARDRVRALAGGLLERGLGAGTPILILSGNSVDHGLLTLAAHYVGVPTAPLAEQYSLVPAAHPQLDHCRW